MPSIKYSENLATNNLQRQWNQNFQKMEPKSYSKEECLAILHTPLPISQITPKSQNAKSTVGTLCKANNDISHDIITSRKEPNWLFVKRNLFCARRNKRITNCLI